MGPRNFYVRPTPLTACDSSVARLTSPSHIVVTSLCSSGVLMLKS